MSTVVEWRNTNLMIDWLIGATLGSPTHVCETLTSRRDVCVTCALPQHATVMITAFMCGGPWTLKSAWQHRQVHGSPLKTAHNLQRLPWIWAFKVSQRSDLIKHLDSSCMTSMLVHVYVFNSSICPNTKGFEAWVTWNLTFQGQSRSNLITYIEPQHGGGGPH